MTTGSSSCRVAPSETRSLHIPRTVLEWRLAPDSSWRSPHVGGLDQQVILICDHGYSTILAAATLVDLGFTKAGDVIGGFAGWRDAALPIVPASQPRRPPGAPAGMGPPDDPRDLTRDLGK